MSKDLGYQNLSVIKGVLPRIFLFYQTIYFCKEEHELLSRIEVRFSSSLFSGIVPREECVRRIFSLDLLLFAIRKRMGKR